MKKTLSLILAALMLASSMTACGKTNPPETEEETKAVETNASESGAVDTDPAETEAPEASYDPSVVTENGAAKTHIVIAESANDTLKWAAEELVYHIKKVSGADVSVVNAVEEGSLPIIIATPDTLPELETMFADDLAWLRDIGNVGDTERYGDDGFAIRSREGKLYIFGATAKGALNGTYDFIEENMGVLWARSDEEKGLIYSEMPTIAIAKTNYREKSPFQIRGWHLSALSDQSVSATMLARNKMNSLSAFSSPKMGIEQFRVAHNLKYLLLNSPSYDPAVTEYWNTNANGTPLSPEASSQINFWSEKAMDAIADAIILYGKEGVAVPGLAVGERCVFVGIEDMNNGLTIPYDSQPFEYAPGEFVDSSSSNFQSTVYFTFWNKIARKVAAECPDLKIATFAYMFTELAPKCKLEDNLIVVIAPIGEDLTSSMYDKSNAQNERILRTQEAWKQITNNLVLYNYYGCFMAADRYSRPIWDKIQEHLQYYASNGFFGLQPEGIGDDGNNYWFKYDGFGGYTAGGEADVPDSATWDMNGMTYWIYSKLCWNPYEDVEALIVEYCDKYYGGASEYMQEYYRLIKKGWDEGKEDLMRTYEWNTGFDMYMDCFVVNPNFEEALHEEILTALDNAWNAANDAEKERIRYLKEMVEAMIGEWTEEF